MTNPPPHHTPSPPFYNKAMSSEMPFSRTHATQLELCDQFVENTPTNCYCYSYYNEWFTKRPTSAPPQTPRWPPGQRLRCLRGRDPWDGQGYDDLTTIPEGLARDSLTMLPQEPLTSLEDRREAGERKSGSSEAPIMCNIFLCSP